MKTCSKCGKSKCAFPKNKPSRDGLSSWCSDCHRDYMRGRKSDPERRRMAARASVAKFPERRRAREKVKDAVRSGRLMPVTSCICADCGQPAKAYDHFLGYALPLSVEPVCHVCHGKRSRGRGEHKKAAGRLLDGVEHNGYPVIGGAK